MGHHNQSTIVNFIVSFGHGSSLRLSSGLVTDRPVPSKAFGQTSLIFKHLLSACSFCVSSHLVLAPVTMKLM